MTVLLGFDGSLLKGALGGASEGVFWTSWNLLGASWGRVDAQGPLGTILNRLGGPQSRLAAIRGRCGPVLGGSCTLLKPSWKRLGLLVAQLQALWGRPTGLRGPSAIKGEFFQHVRFSIVLEGFSVLGPVW